MYETISAGTQKNAAVRRKRKLRRRFLLREGRHALVEHGAETLLFFFLCLSECFRLPSPFAISALAACLLCGRRLLYPLAGILLSLLLRAVWGAQLDLWQYAGLALLTLARLRPPRAVWMASAYAACALSLRLFAQILHPGTQEDLILCTVSLLVGTLCAPAICRALQMAEERRPRLHIDDLLCAVVLAAVMLSGAGRVAIGGVNIGFMLSGLSILLAAGVGGCMASVCAGLLCGISLALCGFSDGYVICYAFSGIVCGLLYGRKRLSLALVYLLCSLFSSYAIRFQLDVGFVAAAAFSGVIFLLLPERGVTAAYIRLRACVPDASNNEAAYAQHMRAQWMGSLRALAEKLPEVRLPAPDPQEQLEDIVTRLCGGCDLTPQCWGPRVRERSDALRAYFIEGNRDNRLEECPRRDAWPALALENERMQQQLLLRCAYAQREREATRTHLSAIAQAMMRISREGGLCDEEDGRLRAEADFVMRRERISGRILYALRVSRRIRIALRYEPVLTRQKQLSQFCQSLSKALEIPLHIAQRGPDIIMLEETSPMMVECCHLTASAGDGQAENGDATMMRSASGGLEFIMLSDGMGHGDEAHTESTQTLELLSLCLDAGYTVADALDAINCIMLGCTDGEQYATVDLLTADLWQCSATLSKLGACPSILISGGALRVLESSALPLGILPEVKASTHQFAFGDGDLLIQFTDGLSDACGGMQALERQIELLLRDNLQRSPEALCTALISAAMRRTGGAPADDMTVLCTRFKKRQIKRREKSFSPDSPYDPADP